ncbi:MAG: PqiC family protein [Deltaproteobacteria bacterium]|nr:PqiC family protein [Deltaproteobacteria bacterium]
MLVQKYLLEYPAPVVRGTPLEQSLGVEKFEVDEAYNRDAMVYRPSPYKSDTYKYSSWRVNPGFMVADYLTRDLRESHLFKAVLTSDGSKLTRFILQGGVREIQELDQGPAWRASLVLNITLLDTFQEEITKRVLFQKNYRATQPLTEKTPAGLAQAMSRALEHLSQQIVTDVYLAAKQASSKP